MAPLRPGRFGAGTESGGTGTYNLSGDGQVFTAKSYVGSARIGRFVQTGGAHAAGAMVVVGCEPGGEGTYEMMDGNLATMLLAIGYSGLGTFVQTGGTVDVSHSLSLGYQPGGSGRYEMQNGEATAANLYVGVFGPGHLILKGGTFGVQTQAYVGDYGGAGTAILDRGGMSVGGELRMQSMTAASDNRGTLQYALHGMTAGQDYGQVLGTTDLQPMAVATLGGTLVAGFSDYAPQTGDRFTLLDEFYGVSGEFDAVSVEGLKAGFQYAVVYGSDSVELVALSDGEIADAVTSVVFVGEAGFGGTCGRIGGTDVRFADTLGGRFAGTYRRLTFQDLWDETPAFTGFRAAGLSKGQLWNLSYDGQYEDSLELTFEYDESLLGSGYDEMKLGIWHHTGSHWEMLSVLDRDLLTNRLTVVTDGLSPFVLGEVPEPSTVVLLAVAAGALLRKRSRR